MRINSYAVAALMFCINIYSGNTQDIPPTTSLVYPGIDDKLVYIADSLGNKIPDFSNAGYKGGGVTIPYVPAGLTHRYSFKKNAKDLVGNAHGILMGHATIHKGKVILDGSNGTYVNLPGGIIAGYSAVTFECWVSIGENNNFERIFDQGSMNGSRGQHDLYLCAHHNSTNDWRLTIMDPQPKEKTITIKGNLNNRTNLYLVCVLDPATGFMGLYADAVLMGSRNDLNSLASVDPDFFFLGRSLFSADSYLKGEIDEFRIYNSALTASQIAANYANGPNVKSASIK